LQNHKTYKKGLIILTLLITSLFITSQINNSLVASGDLGTQVWGNLTTDTVWTSANSPYIITDTIVIPENVKLTIEPGVKVTTQSSSGIMFLINGIIQAHGEATNKIIFDGNENSNFFETNHTVGKGFLDLDYCIIRNGLSAFWLTNTAYLNLTNSDMSNLSQNSYLWYPDQDTYIQYNTFTNCKGIQIGTDDFSSNPAGKVYVQYNLFTNNTGYIINNFASYGLSKIFANNNSFTQTSGVLLKVEQTSTTADMDASQNFWGTSDTAIIDSMIYDKNDDPSCSSYINYLPILDMPDPGAPTAPAPTPTPSPLPTPTATPEPTPSPSTEPAPTTSPNPSITPTATPTASPNNSPTPIPTTNPENPTVNPTLNPTTNPDTTNPNSNPSSTPIIPDSTSTIMTPQDSPTKQPTPNEKSTVDNASTNLPQIALMVSLIALASGLAIYFIKHKW
jgi:hypothetical protein